MDLPDLLLFTVSFLFGFFVMFFWGDIACWFHWKIERRKMFRHYKKCKWFYDNPEMRQQIMQREGWKKDWIEHG